VNFGRELASTTALEDQNETARDSGSCRARMADGSLAMIEVAQTIFA
jgi:hypothetical protein